MRSNKKTTRTRLEFDELEDFLKLVSEESIAEVDRGKLAIDLDAVFNPPDGRAGLRGDWDPRQLAAWFRQHDFKDKRTHEEQRAERLTKLWETIQAHPFYARLMRGDPNFDNALKQFRRLAKKPPGVGYGAPYSELRFIGIVAICVGAHDALPTWIEPYPTLEEARNAYAFATKLARLIDGNVRLPDPVETATLKRLLQSLQQHLRPQVTTGARRPRVDALTPQRHYIDMLIDMLNKAFLSASPKLVMDIAFMMGFEVDSSTIERRIAEVTSRKSQS